MEYQGGTLTLEMTYGVLGSLVEVIKLSKTEDSAKLDAAIDKGEFDK